MSPSDLNSIKDQILAFLSSSPKTRARQFQSNPMTKSKSKLSNLSSMGYSEGPEESREETIELFKNQNTYRVN